MKRKVISMQVFKSIKAYQQWRKAIPAEQSLGFVPTMGALHEGHVSLLKQSKNENDFSVLSIFINPTQFNNPEDFKNYPITLDKDLEKAENSKVDVVLLPEYQEIYKDHYRFKVTENDFSLSLCGANRPGHFNGVLTIVLKLLNIVHANKAYFGEKDYQQLSLIKDMVSAFFIPTEIISCPTIREKSGLAMSSRNQRLSEEEKKSSTVIYKSITESQSASEAQKKIESQGLRVDYVVDYQKRRYAAVQVGPVRLIDNVEI